MHCDALSSDLKVQMRNQVTILVTSVIVPVVADANV